MTEEEKKDVEKKQQAPVQPTRQTPKKSNKTLFIILGVVGGLIACVIIVVGAGLYMLSKNPAVQNIKKGIDKIEKTKSGSYKYKDKKSGSESEVGSNVKKPDKWPSDVPVYDGELKYASTYSEGKVMAVQILTDDDADTVISYYDDKMKGDGWKQLSSGNYGGTRTVAYTNDNKKTVSVSVAKDSSNEAKNRIMVTVANSK